MCDPHRGVGLAAGNFGHVGSLRPSSHATSAATAAASFSRFCAVKSSWCSFASSQGCQRDRKAPIPTQTADLMSLGVTPLDLRSRCLEGQRGRTVVPRARATRSFPSPVVPNRCQRWTSAEIACAGLLRSIMSLTRTVPLFRTRARNRLAHPGFPIGEEDVVAVARDEQGCRDQSQRP